MVHIIIENLLSTSRNRLLFEILWNLSVSKANKPRNCENFSIATICNDLILELRRDDPDRNKFYFNSQLAFGCIQLYRYQIEALFSQVKIALQTCNSTFYDINWLSEMSTQASNASIPSQTKRRDKSATKQKNSKEKDSEKIADFDLIERAFLIPDDPSPKKRSKGKQDLDPTMAINEGSITIIDKENFNGLSKFMEQTNAEMDDEFGDTTQIKFSFTFNTSVANRNENYEDHQEVSEWTVSREHPELLRGLDSQNDSARNDNILDTPICNDILGVLNNQKSTRKRRSPDNVDIANRIGKDAKHLRLNNSASLNILADQNISPFESIANESETVVNDPVAITPLAKTATREASHNEDLLLSLSPVTAVVRKPKKEQKMLIIDRFTKLSNDVLLNNAEHYKEKFTMESPMDSWIMRMYQTKCSDGSYFNSPGSRLFGAAKKLMPVFERNLKKIPLKILKRSLDVHDRCVPATKKLKFENTENQPLIADNATVETASNQFDLPQIEPEELDSITIPEMSELPKATKKNPIAKKPIKKVLSVSDEYREDEKWSKSKIMTDLNSRWQQCDEPITMAKLSLKKNRFVAAGIFFELMVLSKEGVVELSQGNSLEIANIQPGENAELYT